MKQAEISIIIPNFRTPELTKLCLRLLHLNTDLSRVKVIVVDNNSQDESTSYLRSLDWIELIERDPGTESGPVMHARALDLAMTHVDTPLVLIMHTDTLFCDPGWLDYLLTRIHADDRIAGVGSWKLEAVPLWKQFGKVLEDKIRHLLGRKVHAENRFLRSHCALYKTELLRKHTHGFTDNECAGSSVHRLLVAAGFRMEFLPSPELSRYIVHLNHATMILNPRQGDRKTSKASSAQKLAGKLRYELFQKVLNRPDLDSATPLTNSNVNSESPQKQK